MKLSEIARRIGCRMRADADPEICRVAGITDASAGDLTFVANRKYTSHIKDTRASAIILAHDMPEVPLPSLRTDDPYLAFAKALELFFQPVPAKPGIHPTASISRGVEIGPEASIGAYVVIGSGCKIGPRATIYPHVVIYPEVSIGEEAVIHSHAVIRERCILGNRVVLQNGAVIGSDGFGFAPTLNGQYYKICQTGRVVIEDDVEIGTNTAVDRAAVGETIIRRGAKLDNLVQIGHGSEVGENNVLAAQVGLAGSTHLGKNVKAGGQAGFAGHLVVGDNAVITAKSATSHDIPAGAVISGSPAIENSVWLRSVTAFGRLPELVRRLRSLEKSVSKLEARTRPDPEVSDKK